MFRLIRLIVLAAIAMAVAVWVSDRAEARDPPVRDAVSHSILIEGPTQL